MRGRREQQATMLAFVDLEERVPRWSASKYEPDLADRLVRQGHHQLARLDDAPTVAQAYIPVSRDAQVSRKTPRGVVYVVDLGIA